MEQNEYLSVSEWAAKYGKDVGNVRKLIKNGRIPAIKIGNQWAIPKDVEPPADKRVNRENIATGVSPKRTTIWRDKSSSPDFIFLLTLQSL